MAANLPVLKEGLKAIYDELFMLVQAWGKFASKMTQAIIWVYDILGSVGFFFFFSSWNELSYLMDLKITE